MNLAREINNKLDEMLLHNETVADLNKEYEDPDFKLMDENLYYLVVPIEKVLTIQ